MILAGHQPNFLPYLGFFDKMKKCDLFILVDHVQYEKKGWQNRNRVRVKHGSAGWTWLTVPVYTSGHFNQRIIDVKINNTINWGEKHWKTISYSYNKAEYFSDYADYFEAIFTERSWKKLVNLNIELIDFLKKKFEIKTPVVRSSDYHFEGKKTDLLIEMTKSLGCDVYLSGPSTGAKEYVQEEKFQQHGLEHMFQEFTHPIYKQVYKPFVYNMSSIDLLFNHGPESKDILFNIK